MRETERQSKRSGTCCIWMVCCVNNIYNVHWTKPPGIWLDEFWLFDLWWLTQESVRVCVYGFLLCPCCCGVPVMFAFMIDVVVIQTYMQTYSTNPLKCDDTNLSFRGVNSFVLKNVHGIYELSKTVKPCCFCFVSGTRVIIPQKSAALSLLLPLCGIPCIYL